MIKEYLLLKFSDYCKDLYWQFEECGVNGVSVSLFLKARLVNWLLDLVLRFERNIPAQEVDEDEIPF